MPFDFPDVWPTGDRQPTPAELLKIYDDGYPAAVPDPQARDELFGAGLVESFSTACPHLRGLHKRTPAAYLFRALVEAEKRAGLDLLYGTEPQPYGNCVSRGSQHARATTNAVEIFSKGEPETYERPAWESTYRARGHRGHGMNPETAARCDVERGFLWRRRYDFADLRTQNSAWGRGNGWPSEALELMAGHKVGRWISPDTTDEALDLFAAGYACHSGQNLGFSSSPDSRGVHNPRGRWSHDMASVGYDLSRNFWSTDVVFVPNSWGAWNTQPRQWNAEALGPAIPGMIVCELDVWARYFCDGSIYFYCDVEGIPAKQIPDWGSADYL